MTTIWATIFVFGLIVFIHEGGHFITAKATGMQVDEFALGFGPSLFQYKYKDTLYSLRAIPLGGYNKIAGMTPGETLTPKSFNAKSLPARLLVIAAGSLMNFLLAIILFWGIFFFYGLQTPVLDKAIIGSIAENSPAATSKLQANDRIISIGNQPIEQWNDIHQAVEKFPNEIITMQIMRNGEDKSISIIPRYSDTGKRVIVGITPLMEVQHPGFLGSWTMSINNTQRIIYATFMGLYMTVTGTAGADVSGPIGIAQMAGQVAEAGMIYLLGFTAVLSINLGIINLLPVPMLDGGHIIVLLIEGITRRKLPVKALYYVQMVGLTILLALFVYAMASDISKL